MSWLLVPKIPQVKYAFRCSKDQDSEEGKETLSSPGAWRLSASFPSGRGRFAPGLSLWSWDEKFYDMNLKNLFQTFLLMW